MGDFVVECNPHLTDGIYACCCGWTKSFLDASMRQIVSMAESGAPGAALAARSVDLIRSFAASTQSDGRVGHDCSSTIMSYAPDEPVTGQYHSLTYGNRLRTPETVVADPRVGKEAFLLPAIKVDLNLVPHDSKDGTSVSQIFACPRDDGTCSCGSRRYRRCHGDPSNTDRFIRRLNQRRRDRPL